MLTPPKWHLAWLRSQYSSKSIFKKTMFYKQRGNIFDELRKCCNSSSKDLALEALSCWRIWIENQEDEKWLEREICYTAVRPLLTKKYHPLHRDEEVSQAKLNLMWLALQKTQGLMHMEGPQHILEVFIQSCLSWLSCDDISFQIEDLIMKLLRSLFSHDVKSCLMDEKFPHLIIDIWKPNKLFRRLVTTFLELFQNWSKIREKNDMLCIWKHILDHCEWSFTLIPVIVWHKIFKLVDVICSDEAESIINKISFLHKCVISLESVWLNSKYIDCGQVLTTPAEALFKTAIELSVNNEDVYIPFQTFQYCLEISQVLNNRIICSLGNELCINMLSKIEEIESKPLLWGLWCGIASSFTQRLNYEYFEHCRRTDMKLYRKLRSIAVNFDLDRNMLEERSVFLVHEQLSLLRVPIACNNCRASYEMSRERNTAVEIPRSNFKETSRICMMCKPVDRSSDLLRLDTGIEGAPSCICSSANDSFTEIDESGRKRIKTENQNYSFLNCNGTWGFKSARRIAKSRWTVVRHFGLSNLVLCSYFWFRCVNIQKEILITLESWYRRRDLFAPMCLTVLLEELCNIAGKGDDPSMENFVEKVRKVQGKLKEGEISTPIKLFLSFKGSDGVEFYSNAVRFWNDLDEIVNDVDLMKNLNLLKMKNNKSVVRLSMFFFLVNFTKNLFFEERKNNCLELRKLDVEEEEILTVRIVNFMWKVTHYKNSVSSFSFLENMNKVLPTKSDNPLILWTNFVSARQAKVNETDNSVLGDASAQESRCKTTNDNLINIFKCFDEFENKMSKDCDLQFAKSVTKRGKRHQSADAGGRFSLRSRNIVKATLLTKETNVIENSPTVPDLPDTNRTVPFPEWGNENIVDSSEASIKQNNTTKKRRSRKSLNTACETQRKRSRSSENRTPITVTVDEVVQGESRKTDSTPDTPKNRRNSSINLTLPPRGVYSLRKRPLQRPSKFNDMKCLFADDFTKGKSGHNNGEYFNTEGSAQYGCDNVTREHFNQGNSDESCDKVVLEKSVTDMTPVSSDLVPSVDSDDCEKLVSATEDDTKDFVHVTPEKKEVLTHVKVEDTGSEAEEKDFDHKNFERMISELLTNSVEEVENKNDLKMDCENIKIKSVEEAEDYVAPVSETTPMGMKNNRGVKRCLESIDVLTEGKKLKIEADETIVDAEQEEESTAVPVKPVQKPEMPVIQSRGSRMLALIPESPKLHSFHESSLSKQQTMKPPNVVKNSRASRMLALLPELREPNPDMESTPERDTEKIISNDDTSLGEISGSTTGKTHHLTPSRKGSGIGFEFPKRSPFRQRRSIRFDDDRNETVTYFSDSPPCQSIKQGKRVRGSDK